ncbi:MAG TPA: keto-deoxy-phosphogluconate aldolase, partial [Oceanospirillaceae bacterium]|nr:keto-deoxy-phosphogluconate aldolase [Oceanospirillaceae bacterium]
MNLMSQHTQRIDAICAAAPVIPVLKLDNAEQALGVCTALVKGGLKVL